MSHKSNQHPISGEYYPNKSIKEHTYKGPVRTDFKGQLYSVTDAKGFNMQIRSVLSIEQLEKRYSRVVPILDKKKKGGKKK